MQTPTGPLAALQTPQELPLLVAFSDLTGFMRATNRLTPAALFDALDGYYEVLGDIITDAGGTVVKFIGDAALIVFPADATDAGVQALLDLQDRGSAWLKERGLDCHHKIKAHYGPVMAGPMGTRQEKRFDIMGQTVMIAATLQTNGFALTPQVFRSLAPPTRQLFKKHTPPITYIPTAQRHTH